DVYKRQQGLLELANGGSIYFDEITELPLEVQTRITNFLDDGQIQVLGEPIPKKLDVRVIASTSEDIEQAVKQGKIKHELYFRLNVIPLFLPPLRERKSDIKELFENFLNLYGTTENKPILKYDENILTYLENYYWPGNVRELKNVVQRIVLFLEGNFVKLENIPIEILRYKDLERRDDPTTTMERPVLSMREIEKRSIEKALKKANYNKELAAKTLGISRASIYRKMKEYGIE
ncbi:MAG: sigma 54-interacting transcriptional regulator, partial [Leptospiraceae bacterium]|nr:sigma 54-interacting transcriptional regulator [Leptospiraceae bacterium]